MTQTSNDALDASARIADLLHELGERSEPEVMDRVAELLSSVLQLHKAGLGRIINTLDPEQVRNMADDELVGSLLVLHDLHPDDVDTRVRRAIDQLAPQLGAHADSVSVSNVDADGTVHLRLDGTGEGCGSSARTLQSAIEKAILSAAPDVVAVETDGTVADGPTLMQIEPFRPRVGIVEV